MKFAASNQALHPTHEAPWGSGLSIDLLVR
jgi:hypothetical protein